MTKPKGKRVTPNRDARSIVGSERDVAVLFSVAWARFLSTAQVERLAGFPSRRTAQRRLRALLDHGLLRAHLQGEGLLQRDNVYTLTPRGLEMITEAEAARGLDAEPGRMPRFQKLAHALAVRDVFVAFRLAEKERRFELTDFRFEEDLAREPVFRAARLIPDALAALRVSDEARRTFVEVDRARETTTTLRAKFTAWHALLVGACAPFADGTQLLVTVPSEARHRTVLGLVRDAGLADRATVVLAAGLLDSLRAEYSHEPFARPVRAVRTVAEPEAVVIAQDHERRAAAFRPLVG